MLICREIILNIFALLVKNGYVKRVSDEEIVGKVLELNGASENVNIATPLGHGKSLGITKKWVCMIFKPLGNQPFKFQVQCLDSSGNQRLFRFDTKLSETKVKDFFTEVPLGCRPGWNSIEVDMNNLLKRCFTTNLTHINRVQIHAACRLRRVYLSDVFYSDDDLPDDYNIVSLRKIPPILKAEVEATNRSEEVKAS